MEISIKNQLLTFLLSIVLGLLVGFIYEVFKILRMLSGLEFPKNINKKTESCVFPLIGNVKNQRNINTKKRFVLYFIWDFLFFIAITPTFQIFLYAMTFGIVRWYVIFGALIGFAIYQATIGKLFCKIYEYIVFALRVILVYLLYFIKFPFFYVLKRIKKIATAKKNKKSMKKKIKKQPIKECKRQILLTYQAKK